MKKFLINVVNGVFVRLAAEKVCKTVQSAWPYVKDFYKIHYNNLLYRLSDNGKLTISKPHDKNNQRALAEIMEQAFSVDVCTRDNMSHTSKNFSEALKWHRLKESLR